jgi:type IX secretion system PorP/SprF family membrane protein
MGQRNLYSALFAFLLAFNGFGQDIHWSMFNENPLNQNPGNTGAFNGDYRFVGNYRTQWRSVTIPFNTISLSADTKLRDYNDVGVGLQFFHDQVGDGKFQTIEVQTNFSYPFAFMNNKVKVRPGINLGFNQRQLNPDAFYFDSQFDGAKYDPSLSTNESLNTARKSNLSIGTGAAGSYKINDDHETSAGLAFFNLNRPNQGFYGEKVRRDVRTNFFVKHFYQYNNTVAFIPSFNVNIQGKYSEFIPGGNVKYTFINRMGQYRAVYGGIWYRWKDAAYLTLGMDYQNWFAGISYDFNISSLTPASKVRGGFEIAVRYIMFNLKPKKINHRICPDYI